MEIEPIHSHLANGYDILRLLAEASSSKVVGEGAKSAETVAEEEVSGLFDVGIVMTNTSKGGNSSHDVPGRVRIGN